MALQARMASEAKVAFCFLPPACLQDTLLSLDTLLEAEQ